MKEKLKNNKGITLVALVITIIILLILAMVSISLVMNTRIINHANNAVTSYKEAEENEQKQLNAIVDEIGKLTTNQKNEKWWVASSEELAEMQEDKESGSYMVAWNELGSQNGGKYLFTMPNQAILIIFDYYVSNVYSNDTYIYACSEEVANGLSTEYGAKIEAFKWYIVSQATDKTTVKEYTGAAPVQQSELTKIYSTTYLQRVLNSFGK